MIQKATEMGQTIAVAMERSVVKLNVSKSRKEIIEMAKIIKEAAEQSYRLTIPNIK